MTTKYRIAEQVLLGLNKRSHDSNITIPEIMLKVNQGLATLTKREYYLSGQNDGVNMIDGSLVYTFKNIDVEQDSYTLEYYITLPATITSLPYGLGIAQLSPMNNVKYAYRPVALSHNVLYEGLLSQNLESNIGYYTENEKLVLVNVDSTNNPAKLLLKMVLPLDGIDDDAPLNIPMDMQDACINYLITQYAPMPPKDITNDKVDQI